MNCLCRPSRILTVKIYLLDDTDFIHEIRDDLPGQTLLDIVCSRLNLIETTYFGIRYIDDENQTQWLDPVSRLSRQLKIKPHPFKLYFGVKFYAADACKLVEEITRYQLFLQVKQDVLQSRLPVSFELAAELGAYAVQSELGDYDHRRHLKGYVSEFRLLANQTSELETRISELHQQLKGMSPATAELNYLDKVKWHDMYGVDLHPVLGEDSVEYFLGLTPSGIVVLRNKTKVAHYYWPRIAKVYYKGKYFMLRICDKNNELSTYGFETPRKSACKHLWRCCVEHHTFFRLVSSGLQEQTSPNDLISFSSRFRYSKRSSKEDILKSSNSIKRSPPIFVRVPSKRQPRRIMDDFLTSSKTVDSFLKKPNTQPKLYENQYRSTGSIPTTLGIRTNNGYHTPGYNTTTNASITPDSPRSTRSAPWTRTQQRGLFGNTPSSPRSVRSAVSNRNSRPPSKSNRYNRSSSVESHSSIDSCSARRNRQRYRRTSDNESEISHTSGKSGRSGRSGRSHNSHRKRRRSRHRRGDSGSENNSSVRTRARSYSGHRLSSSCSVASTELIDSTNQWLEVQRRQANGLHSNGVQQASVSKSSIVVKSLHSNDSHSDSHSYHKSRRHKKHHNSSSKSPSDSKNRIWSSELAKHLQFDLVDTAGMTEDQLREIPYTVIETKSNGKRVTSTNFKLSKSLSSGNTSCKFSPKESGNGSTRKDRVDRIRGLFIPNEASSGGNRNGSIRSASTLSSRECDKNSSLIRMMSSMSMGDFISPSVSSLSPQDNSALRVSHEHTDSGLGADQDYAYSSERSSDSARYGTNKSSGASSGSHHKTSGPFTSILSHNPKYVSSSWQSSSIQHYENLKIKPPPLTTPASIHLTTGTSNFTNTNNNNPNIGRRNSCTISNNNNHLNNSILNYTTFEQNHYKFSLKENLGDSKDIIRCIPPSYSTNCIDDHSQSSSSYYYPISCIKLSNRGTKSDVGVPIRRQSTTAVANTSIKTNRCKLQSVQSDLALTEEYNTNNKMSPIIEPIHSYRTTIDRKIGGSGGIGVANMSDYKNFETDFNHTNRNDIVLYKNINKPRNSGPLIYIPSNQMMRHHQHQQQHHRQQQNLQQQPQQQQNQDHQNTSSSSYSDMLFQLKSTTYQPTNTNNNYNKATSVTTNTMNPNRSSSLEIILSPIVNSIPRMP